MNIKIVINRPELSIQVEAKDEAERKEAVRAIKFTFEDLGYSLTNEILNRDMQIEEEQLPQESSKKQVLQLLATENQKNYMRRLGIAFDERTCTKAEATAMINTALGK